MGNIFSKKQTLRDRLLNLENNINKIEYELSSLKIAGSFGNISYSLLFSTVIIVFISYLFDLFFYFDSKLFTFVLSIFIIIFSFFIFYFLKISRNNLILKKQKFLDEMKEERKKLIELCKNDVNFAVTKSLIDKYEEDEVRSNYFSQVQTKKRTKMDSFSNLVLGADPETMTALICVKCGNHNGLIDPKNDNFKVYYCYNCKAKNIRKTSLNSPSLSNETNKNEILK